MNFPLPHLMLITDSSAMRGGFAPCIGEALRGAAQADAHILVQIREPYVTPRELLQMMQSARELSQNTSGIFLISGATLQNARHQDEALARELFALCDGVHWPEYFLESDARREYSRATLNGVSIHSHEAAQRASTRGFGYLVFGAIYQTATHPGAAGVGLEKLENICAQTALPVFAIGGIDATNAARVLAAGAYGIAVKSAVWNAKNISDATRELCEIVRDAAAQRASTRNAFRGSPKTGN